MLTVSDGWAVGADGLRIATRRWSKGIGHPLVVAVHATGFCKEVYQPVVAELDGLADSFEVVAHDQRGHGDSDRPELPLDWWDLARDALGVIGESVDVVGVGHSVGGAVLAMAEILRPGTFRRLFLIEPIVPAGPLRPWEDSPLAVAAIKRKRLFASPQAAADNWRGKGPFAEWDPRVLDAYAHGAVRQTTEGWELKCAADVEAAFYRASTLHGAFGRLHEVRTPVVIVAGERSDSHPAPVVGALVDRFSDATSRIVPNTSHFLPMEVPALVAELIATALD